MSVEDETELRTRSKQPKDSKFKQQALPAWQPILTAGNVLPTFFVIGVAFIPIGAALIYFSNEVRELSHDYTNCTSIADDNKPCKDVISDDSSKECQCLVDLVPEKLGNVDWQANVLIYYGLTNFYQNHRRYVKSRSDSQLYGDLTKRDENCKPFLHPPKIEDSTYIPCGAIANSLFSDDIVLEYKQESDSEFRAVPVSRYNIAWPSDKERKFKNPEVPDGKTLEQVFRDAGYSRPKNWHKDIWELDLENEDNNGLQNEDLIVWMRAAALPNFRKLYRRVDHNDELKHPDFNDDFSEGLPVNGYKYRLNITYRFMVDKFEGTKSVIISTTSILGGRNPFLGIAYVVVGCICFLLGVIFLFIHLRFGKTTQELMNITPNTPYMHNSST